MKYVVKLKDGYYSLVGSHSCRQLEAGAEMKKPPKPPPKKEFSGYHCSCGKPLYIDSMHTCPDGAGFSLVGSGSRLVPPRAKKARNR